MAACILYLRPFLNALTSGFINGDDLRRRGAISPYIYAPSNLATTLALKDRRTSSDLDRSQTSNEGAVEPISDDEVSSNLLPQIAHTTSIPDVGRIALGIKDPV